MEPARGRALLVLALIGLAAGGLWLSIRSGNSTSKAPAPEQGLQAEPGSQRPEVPAPKEAPQSSEPAAPEQAPAEDYPSPYAGQSPAEEKRLLELTIQHDEAELASAQRHLDELEKRADQSDEAQDELEEQRAAVRQARAQMAAFKRRIQELNAKLHP